jgi:hypothetical protein
MAMRNARHDIAAANEKAKMHELARQKAERSAKAKPDAWREDRAKPEEAFPKLKVEEDQTKKADIPDPSMSNVKEAAFCEGYAEAMWTSRMHELGVLGDYYADDEDEDETHPRRRAELLLKHNRLVKEGVRSRVKMDGTEWLQSHLVDPREMLEPSEQANAPAGTGFFYLALYGALKDQRSAGGKDEAAST